MAPIVSGYARFSVTPPVTWRRDAPGMTTLDTGLHHGRICTTCRFWQADPDTPANELGECRINAPRFHPLPGDPAEPDTQAGLPRRPWPITECDDWCAHWSRLRSSM